MVRESPEELRGRGSLVRLGALYDATPAVACTPEVILSLTSPASKAVERLLSRESLVLNINELKQVELPDLTPVGAPNLGGFD